MASQRSASHRLEYPERGDFFVDGWYPIEVGWANTIPLFGFVR
ncbi:MAG: hypothetical protein QM434_05550 [Spirochaetota bacterium]|nr:hypothetical protein [Spirochaetota bacterium]